jgi:hypothetical protein
LASKSTKPLLMTEAGLLKKKEGDVPEDQVPSTTNLIILTNLAIFL